jgi:hypothetical protein
MPSSADEFPELRIDLVVPSEKDRASRPGRRRRHPSPPSADDPAQPPRRASWLRTRRDRPGSPAAARTHLGIGAHQDDLEFMAFHGILALTTVTDRWFGGVTITDGRGSSRAGQVQGLDRRPRSPPNGSASRTPPP